MTVLVTGATGKTGRHLIRTLRDRGVPTRAATRSPGASHDAGETVRFDWGDRRTWADAVRGATGLYVVGPFGEPDDDVLVGELIAAAPSLTQVTLVSVIGADHPPAGMAVRAWEQSLRAGDTPWTILRPNWFNQNFGEHLFLPALAGRSELLAPVDGAAVSFVDCRDVAEVAAATFTEPDLAGRVLTLTGGELLNFSEVAHLIARAAGRPVRYPTTSPEQMAQYLAELGLPPFAVTWVLGLFGLIRDGVNAIVTDTVAEVTGHRPRTLADYVVEASAVWSRPRAAA
jgi:uncharacterized protein YbjT (DUF2867 family)